MPNSEHGNPSYLQGGNSDKAKDKLLQEHMEQEHKEARKVATGSVKARKQPLVKRALASEPTEIRNRVLGDVVIPAAKEMVYKGFMTVVSLALYGETRAMPDRPASGLATTRPRTAYNSMYDRRERKQERRPLYDFDEVVFDGDGDILRAKEDAEAVYEEMLLWLEEYGFVSVAEFYEFAGYETKHTDYKWGWEDLRAMVVERVRDGYILNLPKPRPLEN